MTSPVSNAAAVPSGALVVAMDKASARTLTDKIRGTLTVAHGLIVEAYHGRAWVALGHASWDDYCKAEFGGSRMVRLDPVQRVEIVADMRQAGMSTRAIGSALGVGAATVVRDTPTVPSGTVGPTTGVNGKTYQPPVQRQAEDEAGSRKPPRRPLPEAFRDTAFALEKVTRQLERLLADDRFERNLDQVAKHRYDVDRAGRVLADLASRFPRVEPVEPWVDYFARKSKKNEAGPQSPQNRD